jgi:tetratricopeptide (TPR) repeat protein
MGIKTDKDLSEQQRANWLKAIAAIELRNFDYAISLLQSILRQQPEFLMGRQLLRRTEVAKHKAAKKSIFSISTTPIAVMKAQREMKNDPRCAVEMIEKVLEGEPYNRQANLLLKEAAVAAGWPEVGIFALRTLLEDNPRDVKVLHQLGRLHHDIGQNEAEAKVYDRITEIDPLDVEALRLGKDAAARASMTTGGWKQAESYRDLIRDKEIAISVDQQARIQPTGESPVRKDSDLRVRQLEREIGAHEEFLATHGVDDDRHAKRSEDLKIAREKRAEFLIQDARQRLEYNPTDLQTRLELGAHLMDTAHFREALPELQRARQNPSARLKAMNLLGRCYRELGMLDLAAKQLEDAAREILSMNAMKEEILYDLGLVYEEMSAPEKSLYCMKQIYETDCGYKDVAARVESSYAQRKK